MSKTFWRITLGAAALALLLDVVALGDFLLHPFAPDYTFQSPAYRAFMILAAVPLNLLVAGLIMRRVPGNVVGPMLIVWSGSVAFISLRSDIGPGLMTLFYAYNITFGWMGFFLLFLYFPSGKLVPPGAARGVYWLLAAMLLTNPLMIFSTPALQIPSRMPNPLYIPAIGAVYTLILLLALALLAPLLALIVAAAVLRYRRGSLLERQQIKWLVLFGVVTVLYTAAGLVIYPLLIKKEVMDVGTGASGMLFYGLTGVIPPAAIGIAVLRYRLWDIDRIIRRTLVYSILTVILTLAYLGSVLLLQRTFSLLFRASSSDLAIVLSTLLIAALFTPLRAHPGSHRPAFFPPEVRRRAHPQPVQRLRAQPGQPGAHRHGSAGQRDAHHPARDGQPVAEARRSEKRRAHPSRLAAKSGYNRGMPPTIRSMQPQDTGDIFTLELAYAGAYPGAIVVPAELYLSPGFHGGEDVFLTFDGAGLAAYAPLYFQAVSGPDALPHRAWMENKARPGLEQPEAVKDGLLERQVARARELAGRQPGRGVRLAFQYNPNEIPAIAYVESRGFEKAESLYGMRREFDTPLPEAVSPPGITIRRWRMETEAEQRQYVTARNECFPEAPTSLADWQYFLRSTEWAQGTMIAAFDGAELVGCVLAYWPAQGDDDPAGYTENVFTRPAWRGRGIARAMLVEAMQFLREHGRQSARLEVLAKNEGALGVYTGLGYRVLSQSAFYVKDIAPGGG